MVLDIIRDAFLSFFVAVGFALLFETPKKGVITAGLLGGLGHAIRFLLLQYGFGIVSCTLVGCMTIGFLGIYAAHKIHTPPVVFTLPATITMIPGMYAYRTMLGGIRIYEEGTAGAKTAFLVHDTIYNFILTSSLLLCLSIGICIATLIFRKKSIKNVKRLKDLRSKTRIK